MDTTPEPVEREDAAALEWWDSHGKGPGDEAEPLPGAERSSWSRRTVSERQARLAADRELVDRVEVEGLDGKTWHFLSRELVAYATPKVRSWVWTGQVFTLCRKKRMHVRTPPPEGFFLSEADELAEETVAFAITRFQWDVLAPGVWDHNRGASLTTFFMGMCIKQFPTTYTAWCRRKQRAAQQDEAQKKDAHRFHSNGCPVWRSEAMSEPFEPLLESYVPNEIDRAIVRLRSEDYSQAEISQLLGKTEGSIESRLYRLRKMLSAGEGDEDT